MAYTWTTLYYTGVIAILKLHHVPRETCFSFSLSSIGIELLSKAAYRRLIPVDGIHPLIESII